MIDAWNTRPEFLGILVHTPGEVGVHAVPGDAAHRFALRGSGAVLLARPSVYQTMRPIVSLLTMGKRVGCCVDDEDDIARLATRIYTHAPGLGRDLPVGVWSRQTWETRPLGELLFHGR